MLRRCLVGGGVFGFFGVVVCLGGCFVFLFCLFWVFYHATISASFCSIFSAGRWTWLCISPHCYRLNSPCSVRVASLSRCGYW